MSDKVRLARSIASTSGSKATTLRIAGDAEGEPPVAASHLEHAPPAEVDKAAQRGQVGAFGIENGCHLRLSQRRLVRLQGGAAGAVLQRLAAGVLEGGAGIGVDQLSGLDSLEAVPFEERGVRCFQQRSGDSASPEVDVAPALGADRVLDRHVGDLHPPAGREHPVELGEDRVLVGDQVDDAVRDDDVELVAEWEPLSSASTNSTLEAPIAAAAVRALASISCHVDPRHRAVLADHLRGDERVGAG